MPDSTICGHNREALHHTLKIAVRSPWCISEMRDPPIDWRNDSHYVVMMALSDPAKLAAIIAEMLRERGLRASTEMDRPDNRLDIWVNHFPNASHPSEAPGIGIRSCRRGRFGERIVEDLNMPQARTLALALLDAPNATAQDIERMIGEAT